MKVLLIEDEPDLLQEITRFLQEAGHLCEQAATFAEGQEKIHLYEYDLLVLDVTLPDGNGLDLLRELRAGHPQTGVLILSARDSLDDRLRGLDLGADDYLVKPFHFAELNARLNAIIRRRSFQGEDLLHFEEICLDPQAKTVTVSGKPVELTRKEYELLLYFLLNKNRVLSKQAIAEHLWGDDFDLAGNYDFIYVHINHLRKKLGEAGARDYLKSVYGMGYKWTLP